MQKISYFFWTVVGAIGVVFVVSVVMSVKEPREPVSAPTQIPVPAEIR